MRSWELDRFRRLRDDVVRGDDDLPTLGRYELEERLGAGASAVVFRARDRQLGREVAIKVLRSDLGFEETARERFRNETHAAAQLMHPNLVALHDAGEDRGQLYLVMELVDGEPLQARFARGLGADRATIEILEKVARGVAAAHARGIVHRDLKPGNILVTSAGEPKVADFGIAHLLDAPAHLTRTGAPVGTPAYMAPEQVRARKSELSPRTDVYALGAILYQALTGRTPHTAEMIPELYRKIVRDDPTPPRRLAPGTPPALEAIALKALEKEPARRYPDAQAMADDLARYLAGEPVDATLAGLIRRASRRVRRNPAAAGAGVAIALALVAAVGVFGRRGPLRALAPARCGDGVVDPGEACDDANRDDGDACLVTCRWARCGDARIRRMVEECDDGGQDGAGCGSVSCVRCAGGDASYLYPGNGHCYTRHDAPASWREAQQYCAERGGSLLKLSGTNDLRAVTAALLPDGRRSVWIGLHRTSQRSGFLWATGGAPISWMVGRAMSPRQPAGADCVHYHAGGDKDIPAELQMDACDARRSFLCERTPWMVNPRNNHAYRLFMQPGPWEHGRRACAAIGAHLARLDDADTQAFVAGRVDVAAWIDGIDPAGRGHVTWSTGAPLRHQAFGVGEPDYVTGKPDCVLLGEDDLWHDRPCGDGHPYLCEVD